MEPSFCILLGFESSEFRVKGLQKTVKSHNHNVCRRLVQVNEMKSHEVQEIVHRTAAHWLKLAPLYLPLLHCPKGSPVWPVNGSWYVTNTRDLLTIDGKRGLEGKTESMRTVVQQMKGNFAKFCGIFVKGEFWDHLQCSSVPF